jgi:hypothetical protein
MHLPQLVFSVSVWPHAPHVVHIPYFFLTSRITASPLDLTNHRYPTARRSSLVKICKVILDVLVKHLIPSTLFPRPRQASRWSSTTRCECTWLFCCILANSVIPARTRMGDYHRSLTQFATGDKRKDSADKPLEARQRLTVRPVSLSFPQHTRFALISQPSTTRS